MHAERAQWVRDWACLLHEHVREASRDFISEKGRKREYPKAVVLRFLFRALSHLNASFVLLRTSIR